MYPKQLTNDDNRCNQNQQKSNNTKTQVDRIEEEKRKLVLEAFYLRKQAVRKQIESASVRGSSQQIDKIKLE